MFKITEITKEEANKIIETKEPLGLFWFKDKDKFIAIYNSTEYGLIEEFNNKEECLQWLKDWFKKPDIEYLKTLSVKLYGNRKVYYNLLSNSIREFYDDLRETMDDRREAFHAEVKRVSELMTNMIVLKASTEEMEQVIDYSMDVLDAFKCELRCKQSRIDNGIDELEERYGDEV